jgi:hypothetical protein
MSEKYIVDISNRNSDENIKNTLENIDKLLVMAEESEERISSNERNEFILTCISMIGIVFWFATYATMLKDDTSSSWRIAFMTLLLLLGGLMAFQLKKIKKDRKKEKITFNTSIEVVQEILPYYFDKMSILEKTVYNIRLSKLDIVGTETKQEEINLH